ncbi:hypothetical protein MARA_23180 [Mycolicibacterium arabiense]|uniref:Lipoprotein n=2 Tax=Mycolicibacterium arabiense TaxID=1286181 RepID=A0A7I7RXB7_9MYCO|nr:hypothetical protein [Mycolicibacterium arabiense]MCV7373607.1 hypothetical protein [Mycolicibacterium arabiense]BBY48850.1 hypothetical protein MARA_23180 [Mycolicibacterium arabiense]
MQRFRRIYGAHPLHLLAMAACFALWGSVVLVAGPMTFVNTAVWWQSIVVWFVGGAILHDLVLFPLYAIADWSLRTGLAASAGSSHFHVSDVPVINYVRLPVLGTGLTFLIFFPGIIEQGAEFYVNATGLTQEPFLGRWLLLVGAMFAASATAYALRVAWHTRSRRTSAAVVAAVPNGTDSPGD